MPRSLLVFSGQAYEECLHGIDEVRPLTQLNAELQLCGVAWPG